MLFAKVHGLGNDFVLVNLNEEKSLSVDLAGLAEKVCHRNFGVGADGLVLIGPGKEADLAMQIINSDGSVAEMCGNAIRCVAKYAYEHKLVDKTKMTVETGAGIMVPELIIENGKVIAVRVDMGMPGLEREQIPMTGPAGRVINEPLAAGDHVFHITTVSMGNPHCVIFVPDVAAVPLENWGRLVETHPVFPRKTNVEFVQVLNDKEVRMRVWERGAGPTMACGTGACATAVASVLNGHTGKNVKVHLYAGALDIEWAEDNHLYMTGPAEEVFTGDYLIK
ncbi:diaminopimelate epimerase [Desulfallas thermosapovorans]|uniref:Diaminopimelate epimerase n=1 Tax=Desulfallas thermosapovorans DSM 6562 TaxID=1121431 RepID=A0A5S4ZX12_9FIRM|nr:diaminopimelate epimerase [Desulfallas thermosapovorans]TYO97359.1 diaminopimelate epimerase [Desulfallas thermosapovorans DSM 6562]